MKVDAEALRRERMRRALTQKQLAAEAGISYVTVSRMENGSAGPVKPPTLRKLADALGVAPEVLLSWGDDGTGEAAKKLSA